MINGYIFVVMGDGFDLDLEHSQRKGLEGWVEKQILPSAFPFLFRTYGLDYLCVLFTQVVPRVSFWEAPGVPKPTRRWAGSRGRERGRGRRETLVLRKDCPIHWPNKAASLTSQVFVECLEWPLSLGCPCPLGCIGC